MKHYLLGGLPPDVRVPARVARGLCKALLDDYRFANRGNLDPEATVVLDALSYASAAYGDYLDKQRDARTSATGNAETEIVLAEPESVCETGQLSSAEVAECLGITPRHVRNLMHELGAVRVGRAWVYDRERVEDLRLRRAS